MTPLRAVIFDVDGTLATLLNIVAKQLNRISANLARIAWGVRAVETM